MLEEVKRRALVQQKVGTYLLLVIFHLHFQAVLMVLRNLVLPQLKAVVIRKMKIGLIVLLTLKGGVILRHILMVFQMLLLEVIVKLLLKIPQEVTLFPNLLEIHILRRVAGLKVNQICLVIVKVIAMEEVILILKAIAIPTITVPPWIKL